MEPTNTRPTVPSGVQKAASESSPMKRCMRSTKTVYASAVMKNTALIMFVRTHISCDVGGSGPRGGIQEEEETEKEVIQ